MMKTRIWISVAIVVLVVASLDSARSGQAESPRALFPSPFLVEHQLVLTGPRGVEFASDPVIDYYGASWLVSVRPDQSRLVIDFARREMTEVRRKEATYSVISFSTFADLRRRLAEAEARPVGSLRLSAPGAMRSAELRDLRVTELGSKDRGSASPVDSPVLGRPGVRHLRAATEKEGPSAALDVWVDDSIRLSPEARVALAAFETEVLGELVVAEGEIPLARRMAEVRTKANGAFVVRTRRPVSRSVAELTEDIVTRLESVAAIPTEMLSIPEGFRRVPHPLEQMVAFAEEDASHDSSALKH
jgi:hypothetical protein